MTIIPEGKYKGMRLYDETLGGGEHTLPVEMYYLFQNAFKNDYKVFFLKNVPNHLIKISEEELEFFKTSIKNEDETTYLNHTFSENALKIKELQYKDILQIYNLSITNNNIGAYFIYPELINNYYCFHLFLIVKPDFNLEQLLSLNFNIIKVNSVLEYNKDTLTVDLMFKIYDLLNLQFKDYIIPFDELEKTRSYNVFELQEKKDLDNYYDIFFDFEKKNPDADVSNFRFKINELKKKLFLKENELWDIELYKKVNFNKLCMQFYIFHEIIMSDTIFFTNFLQLVDGVSIESSPDGFNINYDSLYHYSLSDLFSYDQYCLFSIFERVCYWGKQ